MEDVEDKVVFVIVHVLTKNAGGQSWVMFNARCLLPLRMLLPQSSPLLQQDGSLPQRSRRSCRLCSSAIASSRRQGGPPYQNLFFFWFLLFFSFFFVFHASTHNPLGRNHLRCRNLGQLQFPPPVRRHQNDHWRNIWLPRGQILETADEELEVPPQTA